MATLNLADGESFVKGRSTDKARELLELAGDRASEVRTTSYGYILPTEILPEGYDAITKADLPAVTTEPGTSTNVNEVFNKGGEPQSQTTSIDAAVAEQAELEAVAQTPAEAEAAAEAEAKAAAEAEGKTAEQATAEQAEADAAAAAALYDPAEHNVSEVEAYLEEADDEEHARVIAAEAEGKQRKTILDLAKTPEGAK